MAELVFVGANANLTPEGNPEYIPDPGPAHDADTTALALYLLKEPVQQWTPTATRNINPQNAPFSMAFTIIKTNALAFGIVINVTVGGGWTTPAGFETDYTLFNSDAASQGSWLVRIDLPNKTVIATPVV